METSIVSNQLRKDWMMLQGPQNNINNLRNHINRGGDPNQHSLLLHAVSKGQPEMVRFLIKSGADVNMKSLWYDLDHDDIVITPIHLVCACDLRQEGIPLTNVKMSDYIEVLKELINAGANVNNIGDLGRTPLHVLVESCISYMVEFAEELINAGADVNATDDNGCTPLHYYLYDFVELSQDVGDVGVALSLINAGARLNIKDQDGESPHSLLEKIFGEDYLLHGARGILNIHRISDIMTPHQNLALAKGLNQRESPIYYLNDDLLQSIRQYLPHLDDRREISIYKDPISGRSKYIGAVDRYISQGINLSPTIQQLSDRLRTSVPNIQFDFPPGSASEKREEPASKRSRLYMDKLDGGRKKKKRTKRKYNR